MAYLNLLAFPSRCPYFSNFIPNPGIGSAENARKEKSVENLHRKLIFSRLFGAWERKRTEIRRKKTRGVHIKIFLCIRQKTSNCSAASPSVPQLLKVRDLHPTNRRTSSMRFASIVSCASRNQPFIPKLEPFSRIKLERALKDLPLIEKSDRELVDYCSTLEGDESYSCWQAYFELKDLEKEAPKADVERLTLETSGVKSLIGCLHGIADMHKLKKNGFNLGKAIKLEEGQRHCPIPNGLPKSAEELLEEEEARMPDSPFTRLLRSKGRFPAWYSPAPDHHTDR